MLTSWLSGLTLSSFQGVQLGRKLTVPLTGDPELSCCEFSEYEGNS